MIETILSAPKTPVKPVTDLLHGIPINDPYRWLENPDSPETRAWLEEQGAYTKSYFEGLPELGPIRRRVEQLLAVETVSQPYMAGNHYFFLKRTPHQEQPVIAMRERESSTEIVLVNPAERGEGAQVSVGILGVSPDGNILAYSVRQGGEDPYAIEFLDINGRKVLPDRLPRGYCDGLILIAEGKGFFYTHFPEDALPHSTERSVCWHSFGQKAMEDAKIFSLDYGKRFRLEIHASSGAHQLVYLVTQFDDPIVSDLYFHDLFSGQPPKLLVKEMPGTFCPVLLEGQIVLLTNWKAPNWRVLGIDLEDPRKENWKEIVPESHLRINGFAVAGGQVFVGYVKEGNSWVNIFDCQGHSLGQLPCPANGTIQFEGWRPESETLFYQFSSFSHPPQIFVYNTTTHINHVWARSNVAFDPALFEMREVRYPSKDGAEVPMFLVGRIRNADDSGPRPAFLTGYGGFGFNLTPRFAVYSAFLLEQGFLLAIPGVRGGSEGGAEWHLAGKRQQRQNAIDDFLCAADWLVDNGYTTKDKLAIGGGSNGGLLVGAALTQRPDLFRAVVCLGPLLDMLRYDKFDLAHEWVEEYGSAESADDFQVLRGYSPYHRVEDATPYPAVMLISGDLDTRCNPMHVRKMAARLQAASNSKHPILLDYKQNWGHWPAQPLSARIQALSRRLAFICHEIAVGV